MPTADEYANAIRENYGDDLAKALKENQPHDRLNEIADSMAEIYNAGLWSYAYNNTNLNSVLEDIANDFGTDFVGETIKMHGLERLFAIAQEREHFEGLMTAWETLRDNT